MPLEIASFTLPSALLTLHTTPTPSRIELCTSSTTGGLTPPLSSFHSLKQHQQSHSPSDAAAQSVPINVMIRPHATSFTYSPTDLEEMLASIETYARAGADGFVFGCLAAVSDGDASSSTSTSISHDPHATSSRTSSSPTTTTTYKIDVPACQTLLAAAAGKECTFHRAFDQLPIEDMEDQLEVLIELGFSAVLTSGGCVQGGAMAGRQVLKRLVERVDGRIDVIVGGGVRSGNVEILKRETGARWFHSSAVVDESEMASREEVELLGRLVRGWDQS